MSWRSWLFPNSQHAKVEKIVRESALAADEFMRPLGDLNLSIVTAADNCAKRVKPYLRPNPELDGGHPELQLGYIYVFYDFLYFFLHMMNREAFEQRWGSDKVAKLQGLVGPSICSVAVDTFFSHSSKEIKSHMKNSFYEKLNAAEMEYATCDKLVSNTSPMDDTALCSRLAENVLMLAGYGANTKDLSAHAAALVDLVQLSVLEILKDINLRERVAAAGEAVMNPKNADSLASLQQWAKTK